MFEKEMFETLEKITDKPVLYEAYTTKTLWNDPYISQKMLSLHLDPKAELATRNHDFIEKSVNWMCNRFSIGEHMKICDFGCGPGIYTSMFAERGADVTGVDFSETSIRYARKNAKEKDLNIDYLCQDYLEFPTDKKFNLLTMIYCDFCVLNDKQRKILLSIFYQVLENDGAIVLDVYSMNHFNATTEKASFEKSSENDFWSNFWAEKPYFCFSNTFKYEGSSVFLDKYTVVEEDRIREIYNWIRCYQIESLKKEFEENGLRITEQYANVAGEADNQSDASVIAIVAEKINS
jgi:SAM-dependent methyltransferase